MPTITINKKDLLKLLGRKIDEKRLLDRITMLGLSIEDIQGEELIIEVFPNRADLLSVEGIARALSSFLGIKKGLRKFKVYNSNYLAKIDKKVKKVRPYAVAAVVKGIKLNDYIIQSIMQLQEKLHETYGRKRRKASIGIYDLDTIKFPLIYTTKPKNFKFVPLDMEKELTLSEILEVHPKGIEYKHLLENFKEFPIWIDSNGQVLSMPPVINSNETRVKETTKNLFIDVTGLDKKTVEDTLNIVVTSLAERGGKVYRVKIENKNYPNLEPKTIKVDIGYCNKVLGLKLDTKKFALLAKKMGFDFLKNKIYYPCYRTDIMHQIDIVEDIAIAYGYENIKESIPKIATIGKEDKLEIIKRKIAEALIGLGFIETFTYHLTSKENQCSKTCVEIPLVEIENPQSEEYSVLRSWLIPILLDVLSKNKHNEYPQKIFESGTIFKLKNGQVEENIRLAVAICDTKADFTDIKQIFEYLIRLLGLNYEIVEEKDHPSFIPGRVIRIAINGKKVAWLGEIHPKVLENFEIEMPVAAFELNLSELFGKEKNKY